MNSTSFDASSGIRLPFSRPLLLLCAGILIATLISAFICQRIIVDSLNNRGNQYGQALANLAARQAIDSTLNHDLVSLQVILSDIADNADVANATIHDVENNILVQAGKRGLRRDEDVLRNYTAPITLHKSIAGYVTVTLDFTHTQQVKAQLFWLFGFMAALLLALTLSALYFGRSWNTPITLPRATIPIVNEPLEAESELELDDDAALPTAAAGRALPNVELIIQLHNLRELQGQLNSQSFRNLSQRLENHLRGILALYAGQLLHLSADQIRIGFHDDEHQAGVFGALCSAYLLRELNAQGKGVQLRISALLRRRSSDSAALRNLPYELQDNDELNQIAGAAVDNEILLESDLFSDADLDQRLACDETEITDILRFDTFLEPYHSLLAKQLHQLQRQ